MPPLALVATVAVYMASARAENRDEPSWGGTIRVNLNADIRSTNPGVNRDSNSDYVVQHIVEGLVALDESQKIRPMLARQVEVSTDLTTYTFHLRESVPFHNGELMTASHVKWSWERILRPENAFLCRWAYDGTFGPAVTSIDTPDEHTVVVRLDGPSAVLLQQAANVQCPVAILHPDSYADDGSWKEPIGTGPFQLSEWARGRHVLLSRFEAYRPLQEPRSGLAGGKVAYADRIRWTVVPDLAAAKAALVSGQLDILTKVPVSSASELALADGVSVQRVETLGRNVLLMNYTDPILADKRIRTAIAHSLDLELLTEVLTGNISKPNPSIVPRTSPWHSAVHDSGYAYDPELARQLLEQAGYKGEPLRIQVNRQYREVYDAAVVIQYLLRKAGLNVELEVLEWATIMSNYFESRFQLMAFEFTPRVDPVFDYKTVLGPKQAMPFMQWDNPDADALITQAVQHAEPDIRQKAFNAAHRLMLKDAQTLNLYNAYVIDASSNRVSGYTTWKSIIPRMWGVWVRN